MGVRNISEVAPLSDSDVACYIIRKLLDYIFNIQWNQNCHTKELVEHSELLFYKVAYSKYDIPSETF